MKKLSKKLALNPKAVAKLNNNQMFAIRGGDDGTNTKRCSTNHPTNCGCVPCPEESN